MPDDDDQILPANDFWHGYERSPVVTEQLISLLSIALHAYPSMRLGQLLINLGHGCDVWGVWDETWIRALENFLAEHESEVR